MDCPKCDGMLNKVYVGTIEVDQCSACAGIWFDMGELNKVLKASDIDSLKRRTEPATEHDSIKTQCPRCHGQGNMIHVKDMDHSIHVDTCVVCYGQWLDGGELEMLRRKGLMEMVLDVFRFG
ncbi:MAG: zf-TFIIB domain-containing protein [Myxococcota bacterium]